MPTVGACQVAVAEFAPAVTVTLRGAPRVSHAAIVRAVGAFFAAAFLARCAFFATCAFLLEAFFLAAPAFLAAGDFAAPPAAGADVAAIGAGSGSGLSSACAIAGEYAATHVTASRTAHTRLRLFHIDYCPPHIKYGIGQHPKDSPRPRAPGLTPMIR